MSSGIDPSFERTVQVFDLVGDTDIQNVVVTPIIIIGTVPMGQSWLVERTSLRYRPGLAPTDPYVSFLLNARGNGPQDIREGTELRPTQGWNANGVYSFFSDEDSPVRFFAGEQVIGIVKLYGDATHNARATVVVQVRAIERVADSATAADTIPVLPVTPGTAQPPHEPTWG